MTKADRIWLWIDDNSGLVVLGLFMVAAFAWTLGVLIEPVVKPREVSEEPTPNLYAVQVVTNIASKPCLCGFCDPDKGIVVPEHLNRLGFDLAEVVETNYLPVVVRKKEGK